jgi:hypothetical protein
VFEGVQIGLEYLMRGVKKKHLPLKTCSKCQRPFYWRKKWERDWEKVKYCSKKCQKA